MCLQVGCRLRLAFKTNLEDPRSLLQQQMQSSKYKDNEECCTVQGKGWSGSSAAGKDVGLEGFFDPNISPDGVLWNRRDMKPSLTEESNPVLDTVSKQLLYVW